MYPEWSAFVVVALAGAFIWLLGLSIFIWRQNKFLSSLFPKSGERDIRKKFEEIVKAVEDFRGELFTLEKELTAIQSQGLQYVQKVKLLRFNPYDDTGGDQSFTVCLLDNQGSGIVITSLHARSGTRVFGKEIVLGKSSKYQLSKEEEIVIKKAMSER